MSVLAKNPNIPLKRVVAVQSLSRVRLFATPQTAALHPSVSQSLLKLMFIESVMLKGERNAMLTCCLCETLDVACHCRASVSLLPIRTDQPGGAVGRTGDVQGWMPPWSWAPSRPAAAQSTQFLSPKQPPSMVRGSLVLIHTVYPLTTPVCTTTPGC